MSFVRFCHHRNVFLFRSYFRKNNFNNNNNYFSRKNLSSIRKISNLDLKGIFPPITTPFNSKGSIDFENLAKNMKRWDEIPFKGYVVQGSNGEFVYLNTAERIDLVRRVCHLANEKKIIIAASGAESTRSTIELTTKMASAGANCVLVMTPFFYKGSTSNANFKTHFTKVADESPVPILLYNVPAHTGVDLNSEVIVELADHPNIIGLKESGGNIAKIGHLVDATKEKDFQILAGSAGFLYSALMLGCVGGICALANLLGKEVCDLQTLFEEGKHEEAIILQKRLIPLNTAVTQKYGIPGLKQSMDWFGFYGGPPRLPMLPLNKHEIKDLKKKFINQGFKV